MLKGLEISVLNLSKLNEWNDRFRFDSEFVKKEYLELEKLLKRSKYKILENTDCKILHPSEVKREYVDKKEGVWFFRTQNIRPLRIEHSNDVFISKKDANRLSKNVIKKYDVMMTRTGANFGQTALYNIDKFAIGSSHTFILRNSYFNQSFLAVFFNSKYGRKLINKGMYGGSQPEIAPYYLLHIPIPDFSDKFQKQIEKFLLDSEELVSNSKQTYTQAEELLLAEVGLQDFSPSTEAVNIKSFSQSFGTSGRLDAEYYQPKYEDYLNIIYQYGGGFEFLSTACVLKDTNYKPIDEKQYQYIELSNIGNSGDVNGCTLGIGKELPSRARRKVNTGDVIISSIEGSLSSCALVSEKYDNALCSTGFYVINSKKINSETLLVLFKSEILQSVLKKNCSGTILTAINKNEFLNIPLPIIALEKQQQIATLVEQSFTLKAQSEHLLEVAKRAVEIAIEEDEATAMAYISSSCK